VPTSPRRHRAWPPHDDVVANSRVKRAKEVRKAKAAEDVVHRHQAVVDEAQEDETVEAAPAHAGVVVVAVAAQQQVAAEDVVHRHQLHGHQAVVDEAQEDDAHDQCHLVEDDPVVDDVHVQRHQPDGAHDQAVDEAQVDDVRADQPPQMLPGGSVSRRSSASDPRKDDLLEDDPVVDDAHGHYLDDMVEDDVHVQSISSIDDLLEDEAQVDDAQDQCHLAEDGVHPVDDVVDDDKVAPQFIILGLCGRPSPGSLFQ